MTTDFEADLRAKMAGINPSLPPDLARNTFDSHRRHQKNRRLKTLASTGGAAAVVGVAAGLVLTSTPAQPTMTTAYVVDHVTSALKSTNLISYSTSNGGSQIWETWIYGDQERSLDVSATTRKPLEGSISTQVGTKVTSVSIDYQRRTWLQESFTTNNNTTTNPCSNNPLTNAASSPEYAAQYWSTNIAAGMKCGAVIVIGHQQLNGNDTIELQTHSKFTATNSGPGSLPYTVTESLQVNFWVNPETYLPVRTVAHVTGKFSIDKTKNTSTSNEITLNYSWLPATKANLADLTAPIPAGFKKVNPYQ